MENAKIPLWELIDKAKRRLQELQYTPATIKVLSRYWRKLLEYADGKQIRYFTVMMGEDYLRDVCHIHVAEEAQAPDLPRWRVTPPKRAVYLLGSVQRAFVKGEFDILRICAKTGKHHRTHGYKDVSYCTNGKLIHDLWKRKPTSPLKRVFIVYLH